MAVLNASLAIAVVVGISVSFSSEPVQTFRSSVSRVQKTKLRNNSAGTRSLRSLLHFRIDYI